MSVKQNIILADGPFHVSLLHLRRILPRSFPAFRTHRVAAPERRTSHLQRMLRKKGREIRLYRENLSLLHFKCGNNSQMPRNGLAYFSGIVQS